MQGARTATKLYHIPSSAERTARNATQHPLDPRSASGFFGNLAMQAETHLERPRATPETSSSQSRIHDTQHLSGTGLTRPPNPNLVSGPLDNSARPFLTPNIGFGLNKATARDKIHAASAGDSCSTQRNEVATMTTASQTSRMNAAGTAAQLPDCPSAGEHPFVLE